MQTPLVDTDVISFLFKHDTRAALYTSHLAGTMPAISFMTLAELERWALIRNWGAAKKAQLAALLSGYTFLFPDAALCRQWAQVVNQVERSGYQIKVQDAWIAATALHYGVPLITHNRKDYAVVSGLTVISEAP
jgi:tRNA(fMet)-specific endonuclease VapC